MRARWARGDFAHRKTSPRWDVWTHEEDEALRALAGTADPSDIAAAIAQRTSSGYVRTETAIVVRIKRLGLSRWRIGLTLRDVERLFGVDHRLIVHGWVEPGYLTGGLRWQARGPYDGWLWQESDIETFLRAYPWLFDAGRMAPGRMRQLAEMTQRREPWITRQQLATTLGLSNTNLDKWFKRGVIPHRRRYVGGGWQRVVRAADVPAIADRIATITHENRSRSARARAERQGWKVRQAA